LKITGVRQGAHDLAIGAQVHRWRRFERRALAIVEGRDLACRRAHDHEAAAADVASGRVGDREREGRGHRGIDGVAASGQNRRAGVACWRRHADDQAVLGRNAEVGLGRRRSLKSQNNRREKWEKTCGHWVSGYDVVVQGSRFNVQGSGFRGSGFGSWVRVQGSPHGP
jgi:hypothetical protein